MRWGRAWLLFFFPKSRPCRSEPGFDIDRQPAVPPVAMTGWTEPLNKERPKRDRP